MSLLRVARNVSDLARLEAFYGALGFEKNNLPQQDLALAERLCVQSVARLRLTLNAQTLELTTCVPAGAPYPLNAPANASIFQHIAILTPDIEAAMERALAAGAQPISRGGPVRLPPASGGVIAWKFRDLDLHPLEFIQHTSAGGYDHSAIVVRNAEASRKFYENLGLRRTHTQRNAGLEQERLDGVPNAAAEIISLRGAKAPGVELLRYDQIIEMPPPRVTDIAADRLVIRADHGGLLSDPDGHFVQLEMT